MVNETAEELVVGHSIIGKWIALARRQQLEPIQVNEVLRRIKEKRPQDWSAEEKLNMVIVCGSLDDERVSELCRELGVFSASPKAMETGLCREKIVGW